MGKHRLGRVTAGGEPLLRCADVSWADLVEFCSDEIVERSAWCIGLPPRLVAVERSGTTPPILVEGLVKLTLVLSSIEAIVLLSLLFTIGNLVLVWPAFAVIPLSPVCEIV